MNASPNAKQDWLANIERNADAPPVDVDLVRAMQEGRGRDAERPSEIPSAGWKDIAIRVMRSVPSDRLLALSGGVAFFTLMAVFPGIATIVSLYGLIADKSTVIGQLNILYGILPPGVIELMKQQIVLVVGSGNDRLGLAFLVSLAIALWSANSGVSALFDALNVVYGEREKRSILHLYTTTLVVTVGSVLFVVIALVGVVVLPATLHLVGLPSLTESAVQVLRWPILLGAVMIGLAVLYRVGPSRNDAQWRWLSWGCIIAALLWLAASMLFSWYVASFDSYNRIYGSLGAAIGFMTWTWLSIFIVLIGAKVNAEMEHQTAQDTTEGPAKPLGERGANMADHVGVSTEE
jgi:membrane protein